MSGVMSGKPMPRMLESEEASELGARGRGAAKRRGSARAAAVSFADDPELQERFLEAFERVLVVRVAARLVGVTPSTVYRHVKRDEAFGARFNEIAGMITTNALEDSAIEMALMRRNPDMHRFLLEGRTKQYAKRQQVDHNHQGKVSLQIKGLGEEREERIIEPDAGPGIEEGSGYLTDESDAD